jgi:hypothetical protein
MRYSPVGTNTPTQKATVFETVNECVEGTLRSLYEPSRVMLRRVPPYETCGGAAGFSQWGFTGIGQALNLVWYRAGMSEKTL